MVNMGSAQSDTLFICRANVGRSQVAEALTNERWPNRAHSAGINVEIEGQQIGGMRIASTVIEVMRRAKNLDISNQRRTRLTQAMLPLYEHIVVMAEPEVVPPWLSDFVVDHPFAEVWDTPDFLDQPAEECHRIIGVIDGCIEKSFS